MEIKEGKFTTGRTYDTPQTIEYSALRIPNFPDEWLVRFKDESRDIAGVMTIFASELTLEGNILRNYDNCNYTDC